MSKPNNSIARVKVPGETGCRPIVPYLIGATGHNYVASLPADMTADDILALRSDVPDVSLLEETTWSALKTKRDNSQLVPGQFYRITDYICTTTISNTSSAGHVFDIIVRADSTNKLNEEASAIQHNGDTYFASNNLSVWKLWYCLDNDISRFSWVDNYGIVIGTTIYFRNSSADDTTKTYGYAWTNGSSTSRFTDTDNPTTETKAYSSRTGGTEYSISSIHEELGKGVIYRMIDEFNNDIPYDFKNILFTSSEKYTNAYTFSYTQSSEIKDASLLGTSKSCFNNVIKESISSNKQQLNFNVFYTTDSTSFACYSNTFSNNCKNNTFGNLCHKNTFGFGCQNNTFSNNCTNNTFGISCTNNTFGNYFSDNTFGNTCTNNTFGISCTYNTFSNNCRLNAFGDSCASNTFGSSCISNAFSNTCTYNTFSNNCSGNTFGNTCTNNTFGSSCTYITFGNSCINNTFGNTCTRITFGNSSSTIDYCRYNIIDNSCQYLYIDESGTASSSNYLQNIHIHLGVAGTSSTYKTITVDRGLSYTTDIYPIGSVEQYI